MSRSVPLSVVVLDEVDVFCCSSVCRDVVGHAPGKAVFDLPCQPAESAVSQPQPKAAFPAPRNDGALPVLDGHQASVLDRCVPAGGHCWCHPGAGQCELVEQGVQLGGVHCGVDVQANGLAVCCCFHGHPYQKVV